MKTFPKFLCLIIVSFSLSAFAGGDLVNNGGGFAEKNILFAYQKLGSYIQMCLSSEFCKLDNTQKSILQQIAAGLKDEQATPGQIQFASEKARPGSFILNGEVKVAKTGSKVGSPIIINIDLLYTKNSMGVYIPVSLPESVAILIHELGHHYGNYSHTDLDLLGVRVAMLLENNIYNTPLIPWSQLISATFINKGPEESFPDIIIYVQDQAIDISEKYQSAIFCPEVSIPIPILPIPDIPVKTSRPRGSIVHNVHWEKFDLKKENHVRLSISGDLSHKCKGQSASFRSQDYRLKIDFNITKGEDGRWTLDEGLAVTQHRDPWWKIIKFGNN
jgi:hypothetical protein